MNLNLKIVNYSLIIFWNFILFFLNMKKYLYLAFVFCFLISWFGFADTTWAQVIISDWVDEYPKILVIESPADDPFFTWDVNTTDHEILSQYPMVRVIRNFAGEAENVLNWTGSEIDDTLPDSNVDTGSIDSIFDDSYESITWDPEFLLAMSWMYENWLTKYSTEELYRPFDNITREESAKMFAQAFLAFGYDSETKNTACDFNDKDDFNPELKDYIQTACSLWLFQWHEWYYYPLNTLSKAEATAVMIRMFEWKLSYETKNPWRADYYKKAFAIWITNIDNINNYDGDLSRYEIALMLYRFRNLLADDSEKGNAEDKIDNINKNTNNDSNSNNQWSIGSGNTGDLENLYDSEAIKNDPELIDAIAWMKDNWITNATWVNNFDTFETLTRADFAVMVDKFSGLFWLWEIKDEYLIDSCNFTDISNLDSLVQIAIQDACKKNLLWWSNWEFNPNWEMTYAEVVVSLVRVINEWEKLSETANPWWSNYYEKAVDVGLVSPWDLANFDNKIIRYQVALLMYRFYNKNLIAGSLNNSTSNILIDVDNSSENNDADFDKNIFENWEVSITYVQVNWTRYKVVKTMKKDYLVGSFVWYADVFDMVNDDKVWTMNIVFSNWNLVESNIRINDETTKIYYDNDSKDFVAS